MGGDVDTYTVAVFQGDTRKLSHMSYDLIYSYKYGTSSYVQNLGYTGSHTYKPRIYKIRLKDVTG